MKFALVKKRFQKKLGLVCKITPIYFRVFSKKKPLKLILTVFYFSYSKGGLAELSKCLLILLTSVKSTGNGLGLLFAFKGPVYFLGIP